MDLRFTERERRFRSEVREWLRSAVTELPDRPALDDWPGRRDYDARWQRRLFDAGYAGIHWPVDCGGKGAGPVEHLIFLEEAERAGAPYAAANFVGVMHAGPTIAAEGTPEQRARHLPPILRGDEVWCQGFSEPESGSDLASLRTRAVRDGDDYVLNGHKIWTSHSSVADFCEILVRTDPDAPKHRGISWLIMPMDAPGIHISPIRTIQGTDDFAEMFLDEVRVPMANRVGAENDGWRVAMVTMSFERGTAFVGELVNALITVERIAALARKSPHRWQDRGIRTEIGTLSAEFEGLWSLTLRNVSQATRGMNPGASGSVFKLHYTELRKRLNALAMQVLGRAGLVTDPDDPDDLVQEHLRGLSLTIAGGTSQIQRNIIAERVLGLPKG